MDSVVGADGVVGCGSVVVTGSVLGHHLPPQSPSQVVCEKQYSSFEKPVHDSQPPEQSNAHLLSVGAGVGAGVDDVGSVVDGVSVVTDGSVVVIGVVVSVVGRVVDEFPSEASQAQSQDGPSHSVHGTGSNVTSGLSHCKSLVI